MPARHQAPKGTFDVLPGAAAGRDALLGAASAIFGRAGYGRIETPVFEDTELFERGVGESTDIVRKEMFSFEDMGGRRLTLRPEGTAPICRAYVQHGMHRLPLPVKLWYLGPYFRHERPQAGRFRQFAQVGAEAIGSGSPMVDAESIMLLDELLGALGVPGVSLRISSLGTAATRAEYRDELREYLRAHESDLSEDVRSRIDQNPMRAFDSDDQSTQAVMAEAPKMIDRLNADDADHFAAVRGLLDQEGVGYEVDPALVRGLDYYSRTVFEFESDQLGAQAALGGGGRYDGLVAQLGGPETPAVGWAAGIERMLLAIGAEPAAAGVAVFIAAPDPQRSRAMAAVMQLRRSGISADLDLAGRSIKGQMKQADRSGAAWSVILDEDGSARLREMSSGEQHNGELAELLEELKEAAR